MNFLKRAWELVSPLVIYSLIQYVVVTAVIFVYIYTKADPGLMGDRSYLAEMARASYDMLDRNVVLISGISALFAILPLYRMLKKEWLKRPYLLRQTEPKTVKYIFVLAASAGMTISVNLFINALEVFKYASGYVQAAEEMYAEPLYMQVIVIGILMPVMEEIIFRGLMYERISNFSGELSAMLLTSFVFGVYHGNLVQGFFPSDDLCLQTHRKLCFSRRFSHGGQYDLPCPEPDGTPVYHGVFGRNRRFCDGRYLWAS